MRVLLLGPYPPPNGGVQTHLVAIQRYLRARGDHCEVINITGAAATAASGVHYPRSGGGVLRLLATLRFDVVHLHVGGMLPSRVLALAAACASVPGASSVFTFHSGGYPSSPQGRTARPNSWRGRVLRRFDRVVGVNAELAGLFRRFGVPDERVHCIEPHSVPQLAEADADGGESPAAARLTAFMREHDPLLLSVGLLEPEYDLPVQIDALAEVRRRYPKAGLAMVGSGSLGSELAALVARSPVSADLLLAGDVPHPSTLRAIEQCDVLLRTTHYDGDAISVREALHFGTPVVATDNGFRPPGVRLVPVGDAGAIAAAVGAELESPRATRRAPHAADDNIAAVYELYRELRHGR